jgi:O-antigen/teichoic acid export membrane protein
MRFGGQSSSAVIYVGVSALTGAAQVFLLPVVTGYLDSAEYGRLAIGLALMAFMMVASDPGTSQMYAVLYFDRRHEWRSLFWQCVYVYVASAVITGSVFFAVYELFPDVFGALPVYYFLMVLVSGFVEVLFQHVRISLRIQQQAWQYGTVMLVRFAVAYAGFIGLLHLGWGLSELKFITQVVVTVALVGLYVALTQGLRAPVSVEPALVKTVLRVGIPMFPVFLLAVASRSSDRFLIGELLSLSDVGNFELAMQITAPLVLLSDNLMEAFRPFFYGKLATGEATPEYVANQQRVFALVLSMAALVLILFSREIVALLSRGSFSTAAELVPVIALGHCVKGMNSFYDSALYFQRKTRFLGLLGASSLLVMLALNWLLLPRIGVMAAAVSFTLSAVIYGLLVYRGWYRIFPVLDAKLLWCALLLGVGLWIASGQVVEVPIKLGVLATGVVAMTRAFRHEIAGFMAWDTRALRRGVE